MHYRIINTFVVSSRLFHYTCIWLLIVTLSLYLVKDVVHSSGNMRVYIYIYIVWTLNSVWPDGTFGRHWIEFCYVGWSHTERSQWNLIQNATIFVQENDFLKFRLILAVILFRLQYVKPTCAFHRWHGRPSAVTLTVPVYSRPKSVERQFLGPWRRWGVDHQYEMFHYNDVIMGAMASRITSLKIAYSTFYSGVDQRKHQSSASLAFVRGIHRWPVNSPHKWPVTQKCFHLMASSQSFDVFFDLSLNKRLSEQSRAGDLRRHWARYDVIVMVH